MYVGALMSDASQRDFFLHWRLEHVHLKYFLFVFYNKLEEFYPNMQSQ
jgi:hypothetical protein